MTDIRTGAPLVGAEIYGGGQGRVDLTDPASSGADGGFSVSYDEPLDLAFWVYYRLQVSPPSAVSSDYFTYIIGRDAPGQVDVRMVPKNAFIRGEVTDQTTSTPLVGVDVSLGRPGRYIETVQTDSQGIFTFELEAYEGGSYTNEGIPLEDQVQTSNLVTPVTDYWVEVNAPGYQLLRTVDEGVAISLLSSVDPQIHTTVNLALVPDGGSTDPGVTVEVEDPYAYNLWLAQYFSSTELADPLITGEGADPDNDGLTNFEEFELETLPNNADTDNDQIPDGWEVANQLNPLVDDAREDPDNDGYDNLLEYRLGKNPREPSDANSQIAIETAVEVVYQTVSGVTYQLESAPSPAGPWEPVGEPFQGDGQEQTQFFSTRGEEKWFYRVELSAP